MENKMKIYLEEIEEKYSEDNSIMNWLLYWRGDKNSCHDCEVKNESWRMDNDLDCLYLGKLEADTIISIFQILRQVILCINSKQRISKDKEGINLIIEQFDILLPKMMH